MKAMDTTSIASIAKTLVGVSAIRRKYEDMNFTDECVTAQYDLIAAFADASDIVALSMAIKADPTNSDAYTAKLKDQLPRFKTSFQTALVDLGLATPEPTPAQ